MSDQLKLVGFASTVDGVDGQIYEAAPVFSDRPDRLMVARGLDWDVSGSHEVSVGDEGYIHFIPTHDQVVVQPGWTVWIAGADFASGLQGCSNTRRQAVSMMLWGRLALRGLRWHAGPRSEFAEFVAGLEADLRAALYEAIFDREELTHGEASIIHNLYSVLPLKERTDRSIASGVYFSEIRDIARYDFTRSVAVDVYRCFPSNAEFDQSVDAMRAELKRPRLSETGRSSPDREDMSTVLMSLLSRLSDGAISRTGQSWLQELQLPVAYWPSRDADINSLAQTTRDRP
ncbi:hypothetical protein [Microbacterium enclense]|uniref:hypothetical protein n=1 Tax=Microbacterium enclense TaxID=993073 RepID=UPI000FE42EAB|nr:hypothetical protein [Microbacterium enclense]